MNAPGSRYVRGVFTLIPFVTVACAEDPAPRVSAEPVVDMKAFEEAFEVVRVVTLEETDDVMTVTPRIVADGQSSMAFTMAFGLGGPEPAVYVADAGRVVAVYGEDLEGLSDQVASLVTPDLVEGKT